MLAAAACGKAGDAGKSAAADSAAAGAAGAAAVPVIAIIRAADWIGSEWSEDALKVGLQESDLEQGRDYEFKISSAQGDLATLPSLIDAAVDAKAKVIVTLQDETLQAAVQRVKTLPIVFNILSDPFAAGAGTSDSNHLANITGVYSPGLRRSRAGQADRAHQARRPQGQAGRHPVQPGRAALGEPQGQDDRRRQEGGARASRRCRSTA